MNTDQGIKVFKYSLTGLLVFIALVLGSCQSSKYQTRMAIEAGASPMAARCALTMESGSDCLLIYAAEANK